MDPITGVKFLEDKVKISYHLRQPYGVPDEKGTKEVFYGEINDLPKPPEIDANREDSIIDIKVPKIGRAICFRYTSMRSGGGPPEESLEGPYLKERVR